MQPKIDLVYVVHMLESIERIDLIWLVVANDLPIVKKALDTMRKTLD